MGEESGWAKVRIGTPESSWRVNAVVVVFEDMALITGVTAALYLALCFVRTAVRKWRQPKKTLLQCLADSLLEVPFRMRLGRFGRPTDIESALLSAMKSTKLSRVCLPELGDDVTFVERYAKTRKMGQQALNQLEYSPLGHVIVQTSLQRRMEVRLRFVDYLVKHPQIAQTQLSADPIFVIGFPRTGTTFLHELLGLHPGVRMHYTWEQINPVPLCSVPRDTSPGERAELMRLDRKKRHNKERRYFSLITSLLGDEIQNIHRIGYDEPEECTTPCSMELPWAVTELIFHVAAAAAGGGGGGKVEDEIYDAGQAFRYYRLFLQLLTWTSEDPDANDKTWMLKCPFHPPYLAALLAEFPRSTIVWTHRNPIECIASACSLYETLACVAVETPSLDRRALGRAVLDYTDMSLRRALAAADAASAAGRVMHIRYADNVKDPKAVCQKIFQNALGGLGLGTGTGMGLGDGGGVWTSRVDAYLAKSKAERLAASKTPGTEKLHDYSLEDYGLSEQIVRERFQHYTDRFSL